MSLTAVKCLIYGLALGGERNRNKEFRFRFRHCRYRNSGRKKNGKFVILWIDFREDIFPVHFYSESESNSLKSIQRVTNFPAFFLPEFLYRQCRNRNRNSLFLFCSPPRNLCNWSLDNVTRSWAWNCSTHLTRHSGFTTFVYRSWIWGLTKSNTNKAIFLSHHYLVLYQGFSSI